MLRLYDKPFNVDMTAQWKTGLKLRVHNCVLMRVSVCAHTHTLRHLRFIYESGIKSS